MVWAKLDDQYPRHKKILAAGAEGLALDVAGICWSNAEGTDGFIPDYALTILYPVKNHAKVAARLVELGRWERDDARSGWHIHDFHDFNPTADAAADVKAKRAEAGRRGGQASASAKAQASAQAGVKQNGNPVPPKGVSTKPLSVGYPDDFEEFWRIYPRKEAKKAALSAWKARRREGVPASEMTTAARNYSVVKQGVERQYLMQPQTFVGKNERWRDFLDTPGLRVVGQTVYSDTGTEFR